ncbi:MAG: DUF6770 family protein [Polaribacter sp.]|uniref:DUF6770 family protein n=1 Tax=Polaribacter sp. TaxID=1920175 RepID=UPI002F35A1AB
MRKIVVIFLLLLQFSFLNAQSKVINNIVKFKMKNTGAFLDVNKDVDGYYFFYEVDKLKKRQREFAINILDKNLNDVATKKMVASKYTVLAGNAFNNQNTLFAFFDYKEKTITLKGFDKKANPIEDRVIVLDKKVSKNLRFQSNSNMLRNLLTPVKNKGFLLTLPNFSGKGQGYSISFIPTDEVSKDWVFNEIPTKRFIHTITPVTVNEKFIVLIDVFGKQMSKKKQFNTIVLNTQSGELLFEKPYDENDPKLISNAFLSKEGNVAVLGQYYEPKAKIIKAESLGLYVDIYDKTGKKVFENKISWAEDVSKVLPVKSESKLKDIGYIFFHDIIKTQNGEYYAIGEQYRKTVSAAGVATAVISGLFGGIQTSGFTQLTIKDVYIFKFDKDFTLTKVEIFDKGTSRIQNLLDFGSPQFSAFVIKARGGFDYVYSQIDKKRDRFYANFIDYERGEKGKKSQLVFKTIIHDDGELSEDKVVLKNRSSYFRVLPGKLGSVLILEYNRKRKQATMHLEKLNIK